MRKRYKKSQNATGKAGVNRVIASAGQLDTDASAFSQAGAREDLLAEGAAVGILPSDVLPLLWETSKEYEKFHFFALCPSPRSVRKAYRLYCKVNGMEPQKDPPSSWYQLYRGEYSAIRKAKKQLAAIKCAGEVHQRFPDWERLEVAARYQGAIDRRTDEIERINDDLVLIQWAFWSLSIDLHGDPLPGIPTWDERTAMYEQMVSAGKAKPLEPDPERLQACQEFLQGMC